MRPLRLELEGFGPYRAPTVVDFAGAELFALTGATGAGKSTIVDAICFALYGNVPRLGDKRLVAPVISQGKVEARVRLDFSVGGATYGAVRVVKSTPAGGATTREARLVRLADDEVLAGNERELGEQVTALLGLTYEHFTTCVAVPQGEFARFLHAKPADRQDLLVQLLDLGLYGAMRDEAKQRRARAAGAAAELERELAGLGETGPDVVAVLERREHDLADLLVVVDRAQDELDALVERDGELARTETEAERRLACLDALALPADLTGDGGDASPVLGARQVLDGARVAEADADRAVVEAETALAALAPRAELERRRDELGSLAELQSRIAKGREVLEPLATAHEAAVAAEAEARGALATAEADLERARRHDLAAAVAVGLTPGDPCPVCGQQVHDLPDTGPSEVTEATTRLEAARAALTLAERELADRSRERTKAETLLERLEEESTGLAQRTADHPPVDELARDLAGLDTAEQALADARQAQAAARTAVEAARRGLEAAEAAERDARQHLLAARDTVADLGPPPPEGHDLRADWQALLAWRDATRTTVAAGLDGTRVTRAELRTAVDALRQEVLDACRRLDLDPGDQPGRAVATAQAATERDLADRRKATERAAEATRELDVQRRAAALAEALATHLTANRFEKWVLDAALRRLLVGATQMLGELSHGAYSLVLDDAATGFSVIDHANADARRSARTLSGGETFLASLALALALADEVAALSTSGQVRLESIFLDEGFGTLDPDTLDTVAAALEELQARGRMVGLISHVAALAEAVPVRFEVRKGPEGATVERVER